MKVPELHLQCTDLQQRDWPCLLTRNSKNEACKRKQQTLILEDFDYRCQSTLSMNISSNKINVVYFGSQCCLGLKL